MPAISTKEILEKYSKKLGSQISSFQAQHESYSGEYIKFKSEMIPEISRYEKWAKSLGNIVRIRVSAKDRSRVQKFLDISHLDVSAEQAVTLSLITMLGIFFLSVMLVVSIYLITGSTDHVLSLTFLGLLVSMVGYHYTSRTPQRLAATWRLKASSEMVPAVLYAVVYMRHTSNLESAIRFAADHLEGPLAFEFKKIFYDVEIGKFSTIKQSLDNYLETWRDYSPEFIESFHLIESSLFEPSESRRIQILEKALQVILDGIYEKMLRYSREIRSPLTNVYMLGIILPTLGLALLPLASTLLGGFLKWYHVIVIFNIIIPFFVLYIASSILLKRPGGHGESSVLELNPNYPQFKSKKPWLIALLISLPFLIIGLLPFILQSPLGNALNLKSDYTFSEIGFPFLQDSKLFDFKNIEDKQTGPFGTFALILSLFIPLSITLFFSTAYKLKTKALINARENTKLLEEEFANSIFQLGNRLGDGVPAEIAFSYVADSTKGQKTHDFFLLVSRNIQQAGLSLESAIFNPKNGAIIYFPSALIATSMKILVQAVKKGLQIAAQSLMSISEYLKNINKINQRLQDLLAEIVSDMKSNMTFLAPLLSGIVVGLTSMITIILNKLQTFQEALGAGNTSGLGNIAEIGRLFDLTQTIPPYFIQLSIGIYIIQISFILTYALTTVESGHDSLKEKYELSKNLKRGFLLYLLTALASIISLAILATIALGSLNA